MLLQITQEDIDQGICGSPRSCAASLAMMRLFPECQYVSTGYRIIIFYYQSRSLYFDAPKEMSDWTRRFDNRSPVKPVTFDIGEFRVGEEARPGED